MIGCKRAKRFLPSHEIRPSDNFSLNGCALPKHLVDMLVEKVNKDLIGTRDASLIAKNHSYFTEVKDFCRGWNISDQARLNFERLLRGILRFPVLLLQNPNYAQGKSFDKMTESGTFHGYDACSNQRIRTCMRSDSGHLPFLPNPSSTKHVGAAKESRSDGVLSYHGNFLKAFKPSVLLSCQCTTNGYPGTCLAALIAAWPGISHQLSKDSILLKHITPKAWPSNATHYITFPADLLLIIIGPGYCRCCRCFANSSIMTISRKLRTTLDSIKKLFPLCLHVIQCMECNRAKPIIEEWRFKNDIFSLYDPSSR